MLGSVRLTHTRLRFWAPRNPDVRARWVPDPLVALVGPRSASGLDAHLAFLCDHRMMGTGMAGGGGGFHEPFRQDHSLGWGWSSILKSGLNSGFPGAGSPGGLRSSPVHPLPGWGQRIIPFELPVTSAHSFLYIRHGTLWSSLFPALPLGSTLLGDSWSSSLSSLLA